MERVNIAIVDQNQFFKLGLGLALQEGFLQNGVKAKITGEERANIIFRAPDKRVSINFCHTQLLQGNFSSIPLYFSILEHKTIFKNPLQSRGRKHYAQRRRGGDRG